MVLKEVKLHNPSMIEVVMAAGSVKGCPRRIAVIACYIPPNYTVPKGRQAMQFASGAVAEAKRRFNDPIIVLSGDFNQWRIEDHLADFPDLSEHDVGPTRGDRCIDRIFSNLSVSVSGTVPPLETDLVNGAAVCKSDHRVAFVQSTVDRVVASKVMSYSYRY